MGRWTGQLPIVLNFVRNFLRFFLNSLKNLGGAVSARNLVRNVLSFFLNFLKMFAISLEVGLQLLSI